MSSRYLSILLGFALILVANSSQAQPSCASWLSATRLFIVSAPSGAGKSTLISMLSKKYPDQFFVSVSATTRSPRAGEVDGRDYLFMNKTDFQNKIAAEGFVEWAEVHGNFYGTPKAPLDAALKAGKNVILNIDVQGAENVRRMFPDLGVRTIFIQPPSVEELRRRLVARGTETEETLNRRLTDAAAEMKRANEYDVTIVNEDLDVALTQLEKTLGAGPKN